jgi:prepilin-type N-terminal cleavage/methylation domain-containing protein
MDRHGFTLIELLIVVVIIGILAAIAIPKFASTKEKAYVATMKSDLRNLATAQESYFYDNSTYYDGAVPNIAAFSYSPSTNVAITVSGVSMVGWAATATHSGAIGATCAIFYGSAAAPAPASTEGEVACN